jgi:hypothetical protein
VSFFNLILFYSVPTQNVAESVLMEREEKMFSYLFLISNVRGIEVSLILIRLISISNVERGSLALR